MKVVLTILGMVSTVFTLTTAHAYESDSHLRVSYVLARAAGLSDAVAKYLSIGNQYIDETATTSAMLLSSQRQLYHFHGDAAEVKTTSHGGGQGIIGHMIKSKLSLAERNHALGSIFLYHGLVQGDLQLFSAGTHTKMDTFGHAGFSNMFGHAPDGHSPDRAFLEPKKYEDMIREMLASYVALKSVLPPEYIDDKAALEYLNKFAEGTHLGRKLNVMDLANSVTISTAVLADAELQSIYRENIYKKYEYKKLALNRIYDSFKQQGKINADVSFNDLFPEAFIRNPSFDTTQVIVQTLMKNAHSEFLKTLEGKDIFDLPKLLEGQSEESFLRRYKLEVERYEARLKEVEAMERRMDVIAEEISDLRLKAEGSVVTDNPTKLSKRTNYLGTIENLELELNTLRERHEGEERRLLSGLGESATAEMLSPEFITMRAQELAQLKLADEMANHLTKDFIPRQRTEYIKQQFEGEYENRDFEKYYKDEAYRRYIHKNFGVNWVTGKESVFAKMSNAVKKFKAMVTGRPMPTEQKARWQAMAERAAKNLIPDSETSERDRAQIIGFNGKSKALWLMKHLKYVLQATPLVYGYFFMKKLSNEAKRFAHDHMTEDMKKAVEDGKYKANILEKTTSAYKNVQEIKSGTRFRCSHLMRLIAN